MPPRTGYGQKAFTCNSVRIVVLRVADSKELAAASDYQCPNSSDIQYFYGTGGRNRIKGLSCATGSAFFEAKTLGVLDSYKEP